VVPPKRNFGRRGTGVGEGREKKEKVVKKNGKSIRKSSLS
jgi:hypothetical protein